MAKILKITIFIAKKKNLKSFRDLAKKLSIKSNELPSLLARGIFAQSCLLVLMEYILVLTIGWPYIHCFINCKTVRSELTNNAL